MTATVLWIAVIVASAASVLQKWLGYQVPAQLLERPVIARVTGLLPIALLGALLATQTLTSGQAIMLDARVLGVAVAALLLWRRAPFLLVVIAGAAVTALLRLAGMP